MLSSLVSSLMSPPLLSQPTSPRVSAMARAIPEPAPMTIATLTYSPTRLRLIRSIMSVLSAQIRVQELLFRLHHDSLYAAGAGSSAPENNPDLGCAQQKSRNVKQSLLWTAASNRIGSTALMFPYRIHGRITFRRITQYLPLLVFTMISIDRFTFTAANIKARSDWSLWQ
jgi:hypothetical protein